MHRDEDTDDDEETGSGGGLGIGDVVSILLRHLMLIAGLGILATGIAAAVSLTMPNRYEGVATVQIDSRARKITNIEGVLSDLKTDNSTLESEVEIIRSRAIATKVIDALRLRDDSEFGALPFWHHWLVSLGLRSEPPGRVQHTPAGEVKTARPTDSFGLLSIAHSVGVTDPERDELAIAFDRRLKVARVRNSLLIEIRFTSADPVKAARVANALSAAYIRSQVETKIKATESASELLDDKLKGLRERVAADERRIEQFKAENKMFDSEGRPLDSTQLQREAELTSSARTKSADARAKYEQARRMMLEGDSHDTVAEVMQNLAIGRLRDDYFRATRREAELATKYGPRHPEMEKVRAEVEKAQGELSSEVGKVIRSLKTEYDLALDRERQQTARLEALKEQISATKDKQWRLRELERDASANKSLYETLLARSRQTEETVTMQTADARVVGEADVPLTPAGPKRTLITLGGLAAGLALGIAIAFLIELGSGGLGRPEDIERSLQVRHLASIPADRRDGDPLADKLGALRLMISASDGPVAEGIRTLRHEIDSRSRSDLARIIVVTSSISGEGKTVVAANLALHYAMTQERTLLIDADMRNRGLTSRLGIERAPGLMDVLAGQHLPEAAVLKDKSSGLHVMPASSGLRAAVSPPEALSGNRLLPVLRRLQASYDVIVIDTPPLLPVVDARLTADAADRIVVVAAWRTTPISKLRRAIKTLGPNARKLDGVVISGMDPSVHADLIGLKAERVVARPGNVQQLRRLRA